MVFCKCKRRIILCHRGIMIRVAICHEKKFIRTLLHGYCRDYFYVRGIISEIKEYISGEAMLVEKFPDVLFLGIRTGQIDGILIKEILYKLHAHTRIVFVEEEHLRLFETLGKNVYGYIREPIRFSLLREKLTEMVYDYFEEINVFYCKQGTSIEKISLMEILYVESYGRYTKIYVRGRTEYLLCERCMGDWVVEQEEGLFLWCHRRFLVNLLHIYQFQGAWIELEQGITIPFSRRRRKECYDTYQHFIGRIHNYEKRNGTIYGYFKEKL